VYKFFRFSIKKLVRDSMYCKDEFVLISKIKVYMEY